MGSTGRVAIVLVGLAGLLAGCKPANEENVRVSSSEADKPRETSAVPNVFEAEDFMGEKIHVLVLPKVEGEAAVELRARASGLDAKTLTARAYGFTVYEARRESETGSAFLSMKDVYHLGSEGKVFVDTRFYYGDGFSALDIAEVSQKNWSCQHAASVSELAKLLTIADAVKGGKGHSEAYEAVHGDGALGKNCFRDQADYEKAGSWVLGPQKIEDNVFIDLERLKGVGNRFTAKFVSSK